MSARAAARGGSAARSRPRAKSVKTKKRASIVDTLPISTDWIKRAGYWALGGLILAIIVTLALAFRVPQTIGTEVGEAVGEAGFSVKRVEIKGLNHMQRLPVYAAALDQDSMALPLVDLGATRARMLRFGWVKEARVSRRWPDTLVVDIVERRPAAIWQHNRRLALIDDEGVVLEQVRLDAMPDLPLVIGPQANRQTATLGRLLGAAPSLKPMLESATWIGGRRWDIGFQSGETLALPEGEEAAKKALVLFARMDQQTPLLGRGLVRFDMRIPGKFVVRVSRQPGGAVPDAPPAAPQPSAPVQSPPADLTKTI
ncbi:cell division protein FtsQ/DivIB [Allosphingosinicella flava]|uniref:Cell division protein FtsQ n=1 Tax=Allosphingosinicella flava TaxID=2771430 RepID=A0A7T2LLH9_9SPHN|nr:cell division protein FtsQ/DivIB [Sphingosinicella flava]QPQ54052.1 cell division protein FtsQ/DivIB [Sphingosinicella flava]